MFVVSGCSLLGEPSSVTIITPEKTSSRTYYDINALQFGDAVLRCVRKTQAKVLRTVTVRMDGAVGRASECEPKGCVFNPCN